MKRHRSTKSKKQEKKPAIGASIILTGRRRADHFAVFVDGEWCWLTSASFIALADLVHAAIQSDQGYVHVKRSAIHRLRKSLGAGAAWIEQGSGEEYRLAVPKPGFGERFGVTTCFAELADLDVVSKDQVEYLRKNCHPCELPEIDQ